VATDRVIAVDVCAVQWCWMVDKATSPDRALRPYSSVAAT